MSILLEFEVCMAAPGGRAAGILVRLTRIRNPLQADRGNLAGQSDANDEPVKMK
jgi:hypothetical protein